MPWLTVIMTSMKLFFFICFFFKQNRINNYNISKNMVDENKYKLKWLRVFKNVCLIIIIIIIITVVKKRRRYYAVNILLFLSEKITIIIII